MRGEVLEGVISAHRCTEGAGRHESDKSLCHAENAAAQRYRISGEAARVAAPIPMFVMGMHEIDDIRVEA